MKNIKPFFRVIILLCSIAMIVSLKFPVWKIILEAPQYPEGLEMKIWADRIAGDVDKINGLNHYIGMALIKEENFPELKFMKYMIIAMGVLGLLVSIFGKRWMLWIFSGYLLICGIWGMYDFWHWEYEYGHNLDPHAAIKIEGMAYQPPLLGWEQLLNFLAGSFPDVGGWLIIGPATLIIFILVYEQFFRKK